MGCGCLWGGWWNVSLHFYCRVSVKMLLSLLMACYIMFCWDWLHVFDLISHIDFSLLKLISSLPLSPIRSLHGVDNERCLMEREAALTMCKQSSIGTPFLEWIASSSLDGYNCLSLQYEKAPKTPQWGILYYLFYHYASEFINVDELYLPTSFWGEGMGAMFVSIELMKVDSIFKLCPFFVVDYILIKTRLFTQLNFSLCFPLQIST